MAERLVGQISLIPLAQSHHILKATHMKHHAHTNNRKDPDYFHTHVDHWWQAALNVHRQTDGEIYFKKCWKPIWKKIKTLRLISIKVLHLL